VDLISPACVEQLNDHQSVQHIFRAFLKGIQLMFVKPQNAFVALSLDTGGWCWINRCIADVFWRQCRWYMHVPACPRLQNVLQVPELEPVKRFLVKNRIIENNIRCCWLEVSWMRRDDVIVVNLCWYRCGTEYSRSQVVPRPEPGHNLQPASRSTVPIFPTSKAVLSISQCSGNVFGAPRWSLFSLLSALAIGTLVGTLGSRLRCWWLHC